ncbi:MAG TPA: cytochrome P450 [Solirubrobacteraceae bacterium]|jgi:cytochrome P450
MATIDHIELDRLPPGPRAPKWLQSLQYTRSPISHWERLRAAFGDFGTGRFNAYGEVVWLSSPADIRDVLLADPTIVHAGEAVRFLEPILGSLSMLILDEEEHLRKRRLLLPAFHGDALSALTPIVQDAVDSAIAQWPVGREFALIPHMKALSLDVILRTVFGLNEPVELKRVRAVITDLVSSFHLVIWGSWQRRSLGARSPWALFERRKAAADDAVLQMIAGRRQDPRMSERPDVLSRMLAAQSEHEETLSDIELRDDLMTLLIAGHETTSVALTWAIGLLARHPEDVERLRVEQLSGADFYLQAVIKECLRLRPIVPFTGRTLTAPMTVRGHRLPAGTKLWIPILLVHVLPECYPDPHAFKPERFLEGNPDPYTWLPFGGGIRRCIGAGLANLEMRATISAVASSVRLKKITFPLERERANGVTLVPRRGGRITVESYKVNQGER